MRQAKLRASWSRGRWQPLGAQPAVHPGGLQRDDASSPHRRCFLCRDPSDSARSAQKFLRCPFFHPDSSNGLRVHRSTTPIDAVGFAESVEKNAVQPLPHARTVPVAKAPPAGHAAAATHLLRKHFPGNARHKKKEDARERGAVRDAGPAAFRLGRLCWKKGFNYFPELIGNERFCHESMPV